MNDEIVPNNPNPGEDPSVHPIESPSSVAPEDIVSEHLGELGVESSTAPGIPSQPAQPESDTNPEKIDTGFTPEELMVGYISLRMGGGLPEEQELRQYFSTRTGRYNVNNGTLCVVTDQEVLVGANTSRTQRLIGSKQLVPDETLSVPFSNGPEAREAIWTNYLHALDDAMFAEQGDRSTVVPEHLDGKTFEGEWFNADELSLWVGPEEIPEARTLDGFPLPVPDYRLGLREDRYGDEREKRFYEVGHFSVNNGVIAFVDGKGIKRFAPSTDDRVAALEAAGYKPGDMYIPMSNDEKIMDEDRAKKWASLLQENQQATQTS